MISAGGEIDIHEIEHDTVHRWATGNQEQSCALRGMGPGIPTLRRGQAPVRVGLEAQVSLKPHYRFQHGDRQNANICQHL